MKMNLEPNTDAIREIATIAPLDINIIVTQYQGSPRIELRKAIDNTDVIKSIITAAYHNQVIVAQPTFVNKLRAISTLVEKGIIYRDEGDLKYYFKI
jgi:hypothetical protein